MTDLTPTGRAPAARDTELSAAAWDLIDEATPATTRRAYREEWARFTTWCTHQQRTPLPATAQTLAEYAAHLAGRELAPSSIGKAMAAITKAHVTANHGEPDRRGAREVLRGYRKRYAKAGGTTKRAPALTLTALQAMVATLDPDTLVGVRDRAVIVLGFAMGARRSEIAALNLTDLEPHAEGLQVTVRLSKTDKEGRGRIVAVPYGSNVATCPVRSVEQWRTALAHHGRDTGPLFVRVDRHGRLGHVATGRGDTDGRITGETVAAIVRRAAVAAGLDAGAAFSGHSLRRGFATAAYAAPDADLVRIARHGGWKEGSAALFGYLEEVDRWRKNPASGIGL
ncbi:tyrosine-type recombinase/integrase [Micromonospora tarensis]|uniref:Tyrosine-type recombinase/integrase n=1 Tax=Micromonospora tarensis TaxID=2806100 RepID=A0ABS1YRC3_9ACTN|nr:tyrosine-type recombinase/integrase [Micromonospora tarensis]MBM0279674.1 tyrosine-type recombinase/integrase [Micromonospora tarensis]